MKLGEEIIIQLPDLATHRIRKTANGRLEIILDDHTVVYGNKGEEFSTEIFMEAVDMILEAIKKIVKIEFDLV